MAKVQEDNSPLSAFDGVISNISGDFGTSASDFINLDASNLDTDDDDVIDLSVKSKTDGTEPSSKDDDDIEPINDDNIDKDDDDEEEQLVEPAKKTKKQKQQDIDFSDDNDDDDTHEGESNQIGLFFDAFSEELGWEVDEDKKPSNIQELVDYMRDLVEEESVPTYSSDKVKDLDDYVKNGGKFEDFYDVTNKINNLENIDISDEDNQKAIIKEYLKASGYNDNQINRKISRWEDAGVLEDEAEDSLELLKEVRETEKKKMLEDQKQTRIQQEENQRQFLTEVTTTIDTLKEIRGIKIPAEDRKKLKDYAFKVGPDGKTQFQKDYAKNVSKNFIESAYFTMKGDAFIKSAKQNGESTAVSKLRQSMRNGTPGRSKHDMNNSSAAPIWKAASSLLGAR